ncbi:hypothetical protein ACFORL_06280 [Legionella dresdenensis]|uniref:Glutathione synthase/Ribosomal protein S6 modification enzyme (Glutaminyl transferase) n=1 Tax=Legionella dresdenensis TaxID=450200 RepID=A0ABV8CEE4_9GAMM
MKFLIATEADDPSALLVKLALEEEGHEVRLLFTADLPTRQKNSIYLESGRSTWVASDDLDGSIADKQYDVVWWWRGRKPFLAKEQFHPDDYHFVRRENYLFHDAIVQNISPAAWWVNDLKAAKTVNSKLYQLKIASACGLTIPDTLVSNNPVDVRTFALKHKYKGMIYKPFCSSFWFEEGRVKISYTVSLNFSDLPANSVLQNTPGIYQQQISKKYELRVTCFGDYLIAARLDSQQHADGKIDWRAIPDGQMSVEPYELPASIADKIRQFMRKTGLVFGSLDFIVSTEGEYIFLEVNEQGQFLWLEQYNAEFNMLDTFVNFLTQKSENFTWNMAKKEHKMAAYQDKIQPILKHNMEHHVNLNNEHYWMAQ